MRHVPYSASSYKNGKESRATMAISAMSAEDSWFNGRHRQQVQPATLCRFGDGMVYSSVAEVGGSGLGGGGGSDDNVIVNIIDDDDGRYGQAASNENHLARKGSAVGISSVGSDTNTTTTKNTSSKVVNNSVLRSDEEDEVIFDDDDDDDEDDYNVRSSDEEYGRRLLLSALSAAAVVPSSRRGDLPLEKWPLYHKKSFLFKRRRRPSLSNVVEIYENCVDDDKCSIAPSPATSAFSTKTTTQCAGTNVVENGASKVAAPAGSGSGPGCLGATLIGGSRGSGDLTSSAVMCGGSVGGVGGANNSKNNNCNNNCISGGGSGRKSATLATQPDTNLNHSFLPDTTVVQTSSASPATRPGRLFGSATDLREQNALKELANFAAAANGNVPSSLPASVHKARRSSLSKSWYGEACSNVVEKLPSFNGSSAADKDGYAAWRRRRTFTSVPEDEDATIGEIGVDSEERVVLLERSVSVPNNDALSTTPTASSATIVAAASAKSTGCCENSTTSPAPPQQTTNGASKLGKWSKSKIDLLLPSLKSLVTMTTNKLSASRPSNLNCRRNSSCVTNNYSTSRFDVRTIGSPLAATLRRNISLNSVQTTSSSRKNASSDNLVEVCLLNKKLRKCNTVLTLSGCISRNSNASGTLHVEPLRPVNRLRVTPNSQDVYTTSRMCSRCSSLLSMASSSRYSLNSAHDFVPVVSPSVLCKVCLNEVPLKDSWTLQHCECSYCVDCVRSYVEFEINQGAYSISCPDAQCEKQGIIMLEEIESLVSLENIEKHKRYRLNKEVEMDKSRTWCPRAGCETVCTLCSTDRCTPQSVHCPTCNMDFCSNCRTSWHAGSPCKSEEVVPGVTFDSELIKCCPMCSVPIEKDEGCAQMLCKRCKHVFCWYCLASLDVSTNFLP
ncbi:uncharacterized protein LOC135847171 isoform X2 [Planococcus citri]|uniref:uncharacterized protein LOC135847171 isoform X2 n=1 Tax=Planococcus citri TaxID=170843 RepID=UPI0031F8332D